MDEKSQSNEIYGLNDVARIVGRSPHTLKYHIYRREKRLSNVGRLIGRALVFTADDLERVKQFYADMSETRAERASASARLRVARQRERAAALQAASEEPAKSAPAKSASKSAPAKSKPAKSKPAKSKPAKSKR